MVGCGKHTLEKDIVTEFGSLLSDPSSLQLRSLVFYSDDTVCGEFNAKNKAGGYIGFSQFIYNSKGVIDSPWDWYDEPRPDALEYAPVIVPTRKLLYQSLDNEKVGGLTSNGKANWCKDGSHKNKELALMAEGAKLALKQHGEEDIAKEERECQATKARNDALEAKVKSGKHDPDDYLIEFRLNVERLTEALICSRAVKSRKKRDLALKDQKYALDNQSR